MDVKGVLCALVSPLLENEDIDMEATARLTSYVVEGGTDGILALGSTGEQIALVPEARMQLLKTVRASMPKEMPLIAGCGATSTRLAVRNVSDAEEAGADAVILTPPCFYPCDDDSMVRYFADVAQAANVPVYLYNISRYVGSKIGLEAVRLLMDNPKIQGIKESDRDEEYLRKLLMLANENRPDFQVIQGSERILLKSFDWGCRAGVTVVGNIAPRIAPELYKAWREHSAADSKHLQQELLDYVAVITMFGTFPKELKACMCSKGLCSARMTAPFVPMDEEQRNQLLVALCKLEAKYAV